MSPRIRRSLAAGLLVAALPLALPAPSQAAGLWEPVPTVWVSRAWSWLESLGLVPGKPAPAPRRSAAQQKAGLVAPGDPSSALEPPPDGGPFQGSGIDPNGSR